jgi:hypothetical protein
MVICCRYFPQEMAGVVIRCHAGKEIFDFLFFSLYNLSGEIRSSYGYKGITQERNTGIAGDMDAAVHPYPVFCHQIHQR